MKSARRQIGQFGGQRAQIRHGYIGFIAIVDKVNLCTDKIRVNGYHDSRDTDWLYDD
jgi:hypothetical protein